MHRILVLLMLLLTPTLALPASPVPTEIYAEIDHGLRPEVVLTDPVSYRGRTLLLGGRVIRTVSDETDVTIEVEGYRLAADDRPETPDQTLGRFTAIGTGLDGSELQPGRLVTLVGKVGGAAPERMSDGVALEIRFIYAWPTPEEQAAKRPPACAPGYCCDPWGADPWCDPWYWGPYPRWRFDLGYYRHRH